ncbi:Testis-specific Y-encoded-like protein 2 [Saguinus oedipus]|uniref:Testis-specific Y-encoded-like protein 2 n=1 Tax=Saguinus oedipus TaxID=9490 RepID=A0ABQ9TEV0_SAGOE|nr:Testis-specific Y-encoded-like protein 2 [Saguinus oedipus]
MSTPPPTNPILSHSFPYSKTKDRREVVIMEDAPNYYADIFSDISDIDETIHDIKISDFMETTDYFETTDNEITDINENIFDSESPDHNEAPNNETTDNNESADDNETTDNNESADDNNENPEDKNTDDNKENPDNNKNTYSNSFFKGGIWGRHGNNQDSSDSDNEADEDSDDEDNDGNEGDNEGSDDDGNEGDNEGSDDDDRDFEYYEKVIEDFDKEQDDYTDVIEIISDESVEEEEGIEEGIQQDEDIYEEEGIEAVWEEGEDSDDSDVEEVVQIPNGWASPGNGGKTGAPLPPFPVIVGPSPNPCAVWSGHPDPEAGRGRCGPRHSCAVPLEALLPPCSPKFSVPFLFLPRR